MHRGSAQGYFTSGMQHTHHRFAQSYFTSGTRIIDLLKITSYQEHPL